VTCWEVQEYKEVVEDRRVAEQVNMQVVDKKEVDTQNRVVGCMVGELCMLEVAAC
jgi:hypothetical protein